MDDLKGLSAHHFKCKKKKIPWLHVARLIGSLTRLKPFNSRNRGLTHSLSHTSLEIRDDILGNQKLIISIDSFSEQNIKHLAPLDRYL